MFSEVFNALLREISFTKEMLGAGVTQIRRAGYATQGIYFQAFTGLGTGLERLGKIVVLLDHFLSHDQEFPPASVMKTSIGHDVNRLYSISQEIRIRRGFKLNHGQELGAEHMTILDVLTSFNKSDRYSNVDFLVGQRGSSSPIARWVLDVDPLLLKKYVSDARLRKICERSASLGRIMSRWGAVMHTSETGEPIVTFEDGAIRTGILEAVGPYRQLATLQIIRYWCEILSELQDEAHRIRSNHVPWFSEVVGGFMNDDSYFRSRRRWDNI